MALMNPDRFEFQAVGTGVFDHEKLWVRDKLTNALFYIYIDNQALEITTPPLTPGQTEEILAPLFETAKRLNYKNNYPALVLMQQELAALKRSSTSQPDKIGHLEQEI